MRARADTLKPRRGLLFVYCTFYILFLLHYTTVHLCIAFIPAIYCTISCTCKVWTIHVMLHYPSYRLKSKARYTDIYPDVNNGCIVLTFP